MTWQDISSAPKVDRDEVFGWVERIDLDRKVSGHRETIYWRQDESGEVTFAGGRWMIRTSGCLIDDYPAEDSGRRVTHWMPLPDPPEAA